MTATRRGFLALAGGALLAGAGCARSGGAQSGGAPGASSTSGGENGGVRQRKIAYGSDKSQYGELSRPAGASSGTVVIVHGGFWRAEYTLSLGRPLASDLAGRGYTVWNLEYRRVGDGGGWTATFDDIAAGIDHLATLSDVDTSRVVAIGHSAGGQLAVWAAGRAAETAQFGSAKVSLTGVVSQAGVLDLVTAAQDAVGGSAAPDLMGGSPRKVADRYHLADPIQRVPLDIPVLCLHSTADANVPYAQSTAYVAAARRAGAAAMLHETDGDHFTLIDPSTPAWAAARDALPDLLAGRLPG